MIRTVNALVVRHRGESTADLRSFPELFLFGGHGACWNANDEPRLVPDSYRVTVGSAFIGKYIVDRIVKDGERFRKDLRRLFVGGVGRLGLYAEYVFLKVVELGKMGSQTLQSVYRRPDIHSWRLDETRKVWEIDDSADATMMLKEVEWRGGTGGSIEGQYTVPYLFIPAVPNYPSIHYYTVHDVKVGRATVRVFVWGQVTIAKHYHRVDFHVLLRHAQGCRAAMNQRRRLHVYLLIVRPDGDDRTEANLELLWNEDGYNEFKVWLKQNPKVTFEMLSWNICLSRMEHLLASSRSGS
jgi:hypothetical protein